MTPTPMSTFLTAVTSAVTTILTSLLGYMTQLTGWVIGDDLAIFFFAIMVIMLALHVIYSLVHSFS